MRELFAHTHIYKDGKEDNTVSKNMAFFHYFLHFFFSCYNIVYNINKKDTYGTFSPSFSTRTTPLYPYLAIMGTGEEMKLEMLFLE